jgi:hypothetical protein
MGPENELRDRMWMLLTTELRKDRIEATVFQVVTTTRYPSNALFPLDVLGQEAVNVPTP